MKNLIFFSIPLCAILVEKKPMPHSINNSYCFNRASKSAQELFFEENILTNQKKRELIEQQIKTSKAKERYFTLAANRIEEKSAMDLLSTIYEP